jgi:hypothetical protein
VRLEELLESDPRRALPLLHHVRRLYQRMSRYPDDVREAAMKSWRLRLELFRLRGDHGRAGDEAEKARLVKSMRALLGRQFDYDQVVREYDIKRVGKDIKELRAEVQRRRKDRKKIVEEKLEKLLKRRDRQVPGAKPPPTVSGAAAGGRPERLAPRTDGALRAPPVQGDRPGARERPAGPGRRGGRRRWRRRPLSEDEIKELLAFVKEHMPEAVHAELVKLLKEDRRRAMPLLRYVQRLHDRFKRYPPDVGKAFMASHKINVALFKARGEYLKATGEEAKTALKEKMRGLLAEQFDFDEVVKKYEITRLEKHLVDLKAELGRRKKDRDAVIEEKLQKLLKARGWPRPGARGSYRQRGAAPSPAR